MTPEEEIAKLKDELVRVHDRARSYKDIWERQNTAIAVLCSKAGAPHGSPHDIHTLESCVKRLLRNLADPLFIK